MSDIDAEILALADGDDSSDEEAAAAQPKRGSSGEAGGGDSGEESGEVSGRRSGKSSARTKRTRDAGDKDDDGADLYALFAYIELPIHWSLSILSCIAISTFSLCSSLRQS